MAAELSDSTVIPWVLGIAATMITASIAWVGRNISDVVKRIAVHAEKLNNHGDRLNNHGDRLSRVEDKAAAIDRDVAVLQAGRPATHGGGLTEPGSGG